MICSMFCSVNHLSQLFFKQIVCFIRPCWHHDIVYSATEHCSELLQKASLDCGFLKT
uniref:Uncharacterized protein n=1 Tax=Rhizophora mucronata TaxID=61149 RepID=A0A2P2QK03_RHIMU